MKAVKLLICLLLALSILALPSAASALPGTGHAATSAVPAASNEDGFEITLTANKYNITSNSGLSALSIDGFAPLDSPGDPGLPHRVYNLLLPPTVDLSSVRLSVVKIDKEPLAGSHQFAPVRPMVTEDGGRRAEDWGEGKEIRNGYNMKVYGRSADFPAEAVRLLPYGQLRKWKSVGVDFTPFQVNPVSGRLQHIKSATVRISYNLDAAGDSIAATADSIMAEVATQSFENYSQFSADYQVQGDMPGGATYDYVIITTAAIQAGSTKLASFVSHKQSRGHSVLVVTEANWGLVAGVAPNNKPEKIRKWLQDNYLTLGVSYVLLIGDPTPDYGTEGDIPMKGCWPRRGSGSDEQAPTDMYYADLTGNWDLNGNGYFGEFADCGPGGVDVNPEVYVGRIPVYSADYATLDSILQKIMDYDNEGNIAWRKSALLPMSFSDASTDGAYLSEQMRNNFLNAAGYASWRMYQQGSGCAAADSIYTSDEELRPGLYVRDRWAANDYGIVAWVGHGSQTGAYSGYSGCASGAFFTSTDRSSLDDNHPSFTYQCSCTNGYPENSGNLQYSLLKKGGISTMGATRVSWYMPGETDFVNSTTNAGIGYEYIKRLVQDETGGKALALTRQTLGAPTSATRLMNYQVFNLYGDPAVGLAVQGNFTIVALPDTQYYSAFYPAIFTTQTQWIKENKTARNIVFATQEGDIIDVNITTQWSNANTSMSVLDGQVPYGIAPGNHDGAPGGTAKFNTYFPYTRYSGNSWYGGHYGSDNDNSYQLFSGGGLDFIILHIEYGADSNVLAWADGVLKAYPSRKAIVTSHYILNSDGTFGTYGTNIYNTLKGNPNLFLMLCGHMSGEAQRYDTYNGNTVYTLLADYQERSKGGDGWLRTMEFSPGGNTVAVRTYSPTLNRYETDADSQFTLYLSTGTYGFMGIGTDNPQRPLHLVGNACLFERNQDSAGFIIKRAAANRWVFGVDDLPQSQFVIKTYPETTGISTVRMAIDLNGNISIPGALSKGSGTFKIDHPLDPANKYLSHSFVESPDMLNVYNGSAVLDGEGKAVIQLPAYFETLNRDFSYQLEGVGEYAPLYIEREIKDNNFTIVGGRPGMKVSWQVVGIRQDPYATAHPVIVEQGKPAGE